MPSFDIVNEPDLQEIDNAINQAKKEASQRYDFKNAIPEIDFNKTEKTIKIVAADEMKFKAVKDIIALRFAARKLSARILDWGKEEQAHLGAIRCTAKLRDGIDADTARMIVKLVKESRIKVQTAIEGPKLRVTGKNIDDLQAVIALCRASKEVEIPLQFVNMKR